MRGGHHDPPLYSFVDEIDRGVVIRVGVPERQDDPFARAHVQAVLGTRAFGGQRDLPNQPGVAGSGPSEHVGVCRHDPVRILRSALVRVYERPLQVHPRDQLLVGQRFQDIQLPNNFLLIGANEASQQGRRSVPTME